MRYAAYHADTGRIDGIILASDAAAAAQQAPGLRIKPLIRGDNATHYINPATDRVKQRPPSPTGFSSLSPPADGATATTLTLPAGSRVTVRPPSGPPQRATIADDTLALVCLCPGAYTVIVEAPFPYRRSEVMIHAN